MARGLKKPPQYLQTAPAKATTPPTPLNLSDGQALKRALDEAAAKVLHSPGLLPCSSLTSIHTVSSALSLPAGTHFAWTGGDLLCQQCQAWLGAHNVSVPALNSFDYLGHCLACQAEVCYRFAGVLWLW